MVTVKFFGMIRIHSNLKIVEVAEGSIQEIIDELVKKHSQVDKTLLHQSIIMLNKVQLNGSRRLKQRVKSGDELVFLSPASGG